METDLSSAFYHCHTLQQERLMTWLSRYGWKSGGGRGLFHSDLFRLSLCFAAFQFSGSIWVSVAWQRAGRTGVYVDRLVHHPSCPQQDPLPFWVKVSVFLPPPSLSLSLFFITWEFRKLQSLVMRSRSQLKLFERVLFFISEWVCVCVCACVRACVRACVCEHSIENEDDRVEGILASSSERNMKYTKK